MKHHNEEQHTHNNITSNYTILKVETNIYKNENY